ncbi:MAG: DUF58 domain-containing protein [Polyangia bacterium]
MSHLHARLRRWLRPPRRFKLTREGKWFIAATLLLGFAAVNGGINLLFLSFGLLLCLLIANGVISESCMRKLEVTRLLPATLHAREPFLVGIRVRNSKARLAAFALEVEDITGNGKPVDRRCFFLKIPAGRQQETFYRRTLPERGIERLRGLRLSTRFPFGLLRRSLDITAPADLLVYPALVPVSDEDVPAEPSALGDGAGVTRARSGDCHGLRELRPGDDPRDIHWRTTARRGRPFVREFEEDTERSVVIVLETRTAASTKAFEAAVSRAASLAILFVRRGLRVGLCAGDTFIAPASGNATALLRCLALVQMSSGEAASPAVLMRHWRGKQVNVSVAAGSG